ncbi:MAG: adenylosuccinate lyase [Bacteroidota bacterium]
MNKNDLIKELRTIKNAMRIYRDKSADFVLSHPETLPYLLEIIFENPKDRISVKASWILELVCLKNPLLIAPHLDYFTDNLQKISHESALRSLSKICMFISKAYYLKKENDLIDMLTINHKEKIIELSFDWMIDNQRVAIQVYAMDTLFLMGTEFDWIHPELKITLQQNISKGSKGYKAHAKMILSKI